MAKPWARAFYLSKLWRQQRQHALNRDRYSCVDCGGRAEEVHHIVELTPENTTHWALLTYRYINGLQWYTVADLMNYTENWVKVDLKQAALADFEARWGKNHL